MPRKAQTGLTEKVVRDAKPGTSAYVIWDNQIAGLGLRVFPKGVKSYILNYRVNGRERRSTLGRASDISLKAVRVLASDELMNIRAGDDPLRRREVKMSAPTVNDGLDRFFREHVPHRQSLGRMSAKTAQVYGHQADAHLRPHIGNLKIDAVTRGDVEGMVKGIPGVQRNRVIAFTSRLFNWFEDLEIRTTGNPAKRIEKAVEQPRDRVLDASEIASLVDALNDLHDHPAQVAAIKFAALTGLRIGEVLSIQWDHVDFEAGRLLLPETKTGRRHHDLPAPVLDLLAGLPRVNDRPYVFATRKGKPTYRHCRFVFSKAVEAAGLVDVRLHDLRRTVMTHAARAGAGAYVLRDLLGHKSTVMADRYIRALGNPVREAREQVAGQMAAMMSGQTGDVVPMRRRQ